MLVNLLNKGMPPNSKAPYSRTLIENAISKSLDALASATINLRKKRGRDTAALSGLCPIYDGGPFDDFVRDGAVQPHLSHLVPRLVERRTLEES